MRDQRLQDLGQRLKQASRRSSFGQYIRENFREFEVTLKESGTRWAVVARWAVDSDLTGGRALTPAAAKKTFDRIRREKDKEARAGSAVRDGIVEIVRPAQSAAPVDAAEMHERLMDRLDRPWEPKDKPRKPEAPPSQDDAALDARLEKALTLMDSAADPKPKPRSSDPLERAREQLRKSDERMR